MRFARQNRIEGTSLIDAVNRAQLGSIDADLGGGVVKQRVARQGGGRSGGFRVILLFRRDDRAIFVFGFAKNDREIGPDELVAFKALAAEPPNYDSNQVETAIERGVLSKILNGNETMRKTYKTKALQAVHETAADLSEAGLLEKKTMRKFDELCLYAGARTDPRRH